MTHVLYFVSNIMHLKTNNCYWDFNYLQLSFPFSDSLGENKVGSRYTYCRLFFSNLRRGVWSDCVLANTYAHMAEQASARVTCRTDARAHVDFPHTAHAVEVNIARPQTWDAAPNVAECQAREIEAPADGTWQRQQYRRDPIAPHLGGRKYLQHGMGEWGEGGRGCGGRWGWG